MRSFIKKIFGSSSKDSSKQKSSESSGFSGEMNLKAIVVSDLGNVRTNNEDVGYFIRPNDLAVRKMKGFLGIVADGMGGHAAGEVASELAAETIRATYYEAKDDIKTSLRKAFTLANTRIFEESQLDASKKGMGTTATAVVIHGKQIYFSHVGDSRLYHINDRGISQLSLDHTYIQELLRKGEITAEKLASHPERNVLLRAMGTQRTVEIDTEKVGFEFQLGDRLLLCSDGLYDYLNDEEIFEIAKSSELKTCAYKLIETAKTRGGHDNITVVIIESQNESNLLTNRVTAELEGVNTEDSLITKEIDI